MYVCMYDMLPERLCISYFQHRGPLVAIYWLDFPIRSHSPEGSPWLHIGRVFRHLRTPLFLDAFIEGNPLELSGSYLEWEKNGWATIWCRSHDD